MTKGKTVSQGGSTEVGRAQGAHMPFGGGQLGRAPHLPLLSQSPTGG